MNKLIENSIDPKKLLKLSIDSTNTDGIHNVVCQLTNLISLELGKIKVFIDFKLLFTHLRSLRSLLVHFFFTKASAETLN